MKSIMPGVDMGKSAPNQKLYIDNWDREKKKQGGFFFSLYVGVNICYKTKRTTLPTLNMWSFAVM